MWVVPGAPLEGGAGWRIWCSRPGRDDFEPGSVTVRRVGASLACTRDWKLLHAPDGLERRMGILTVMLPDTEAEAHAGDAYEIGIGGAEGGPFTWRTLPRAVGEGVTFLVASCFWLDADKEGAYAAGLRFLRDSKQPAFKLLIGDQLYLDFPIPAYHLRFPPFPPTADAAVRSVGNRYEEYWGNTPYRRALQAAPNFFTCDDHEFWNNFPEHQLWLRGSAEDLQAVTAKATLDVYEAFQHSANPDGKPYYRFRVGNVSFFVSDARSRRTDLKIGPPPGSFFSDEQWAELEAWAQELDGPGVLVLAQPLFDKAGGKTDRSLSSFSGDYGHLCHIFEQALSPDVGGKPHDILIISGDIHTGRYSRATLVGLGGLADVHEFVASPASRVGPYLTKAKPKPAPVRFTSSWDGATRIWDVSEIDFSRTVDNNVGVVSMATGTNDRVRFELELWRVRRLNKRSVWHLITGKPDTVAPFVPLFKRELQLR